MARRKNGKMRSMADAGARKDVQRAVAGSWLEGVFGWTPLISDVQDGAKALARICNSGGSSIQRVAHFAEDQQKTPLSEGPVGSYSGWSSVYSRGEELVRYRVSYFGGVYVEYPKVAVMQQLGLSWADLPATIWELIPGSFLLDYFVNIQELIDSVRVLNVNWSYLGRSELRVARATSQLSRVDPMPDIPNVYTGSKFTAHGGMSTVDKVIFTRTGLEATSLIPSVQVEIPGLTSRHALNIYALFAQATATTKAVVS
jgi:hypothetical protein